MRREQADSTLRNGMNDEQKVYDIVQRLGCVNELSVVYAFPRIDVYGVIRALIQRSLIERTATGALEITVKNAVLTPVLSAPPQAAENVAEPRKPTRKIFFSSQSPEESKATDGQQYRSLFDAYLDRGDSIHDPLQKSARQPLP